MIYVEFLVAFVPVFTLFLGICQLCLLSTASLIVRHAAYRAVRSAVVVLAESPARHDDAPRGNLMEGRSSVAESAQPLMAALGLSPGPDLPSPGELSGSSNSDGGPQRGARMVPIRLSAYAPMLALAPSPSGRDAQGSATLFSSVSGPEPTTLALALAYLRSASAVTVHAQAGREVVTREPIAHDADVTVRVTLLYECGVPVVRSFMCRSLASLLPETPATREQRTLKIRMGYAESAERLIDRTTPNARYVVLSSEVTLPNQGALYERPQGG